MKQGQNCMLTLVGLGVYKNKNQKTLKKLQDPQ